MKKGKILIVGLIALLMAGGLVLAGCGSTGKAPNSFVLGKSTPVTIQLRQGLAFDQAFREVSFILLQNNFQTETLQPEAGFIRTNWRLWVTPKGETFEGYRVRVSITFNPARTQVIVNVLGQLLDRKGNWQDGWDRAITEDLRQELTMSVGN